LVFGGFCSTSATIVSAALLDSPAESARQQRRRRHARDDQFEPTATRDVTFR
jgi:hypothetical protein